MSVIATIVLFMVDREGELWLKGPYICPLVLFCLSRLDGVCYVLRLPEKGVKHCVLGLEAYLRRNGSMVSRKAQYTFSKETIIMGTLVHTIKRIFSSTIRNINRSL